MVINLAWISVPISVVALVVSVASWWHNWSTHRDKRYGDIAALRSQLLQRLIKLGDKLGEMEEALDIVELKLRVPGAFTEEHRKDVDRRTGRVQHLTWIQAEAKELKDQIERDRPQGNNSSRYLRFLQSAGHSVALMETKADSLERLRRLRIEMILTGTSPRRTVGDLLAREIERQKELGNENPTKIELQDDPTELEPISRA